MPTINPFTVIFTWNDYDEYAFELQQNIISITGQCCVVSSHSGSEVAHKDWYYIGDDAYYTKQWNMALHLFRNNRIYNTLVQIQADAKCDDWIWFYECLEKSYARFNWGIYSPYIDWSGHYPPTEFIEHHGGYRSIKRTDCTVWAINETILLQGVDSFDINNKYGWGIDKFYNDLSIKSDREIILDYNITINHPKNSNYDHNLAIEQSKITESEFNKPLKISLCTTCCNRIEDLRYTLPHNMKFIELYNKPVEWVIVDYNSTNKTEIKLALDEIKKPSNLDLKLIRSNEKWNIGRAKKLVHDSATGDVLINIDSDNFLGASYLDMIHQEISTNRLSIIYFSWTEEFRRYRDEYGLDLGFMGKIAISKGIYKAIGGYTTDLIGYGGDDTDLINRAILLPINKVILNDKLKYWCKTIPTIDIDTIELNMVENHVNHDIITNKAEERKLLPESIRHKSIEIRTCDESLDDECIHELYDNIYKTNNINITILKWGQNKGNKLKNTIITKLADIIRPKFNDILDISTWLTQILNEIFNTSLSVEHVHNKYKPLEIITNQPIDEFVIVTSLSTYSTHLLTQPISLQTWKNSGLTIYSVNTKDEIEFLQNDYPEIDHWIECDDVSKLFAVPSQKINNLLNVSLDINKPIILINSDIEINASKEILNSFPSIGIRKNYSKYKSMSEIENEGIDIYLLTPEIISNIPQSDFAIGRPFWDYWLLYHLEQMIPEINILNNSFYHKKHPVQWNKSECDIGFYYMRDQYNIPVDFNWIKWRRSKGYTKWRKSI